MIATLVRVGWLNLKRDRAAQAMTFLLPIIFFSIFASVFGNQGGDAMSSIRVAIVDEDQTAASGRLVSAIQKEEALRLRSTAEPASEGAAGAPLDRAAAEALVRNGDLPIAIVIPAGTEQAIATTGLSAVKLTLLVDPSDPIASQVVQGLLQKAVMANAPELAIASGVQQFEKYAGPMTDAQRQAMSGYLSELEAGSSGGGGTARLGVDVVNVVGGGGGEETDLVAFYAAGIGVMFLLFSCSSAGGTLIDEVDSGTLERLIGSRAGMTGVLAGKWIFITLLGFIQLTVMFVWGALVFGLDLWSHIPGFVVMSMFSAAAAAAFGLVLATASRTRAQLSGMSTILILTMSALGGSMFPRFLMSETMQRMGLVTFNAWALDGYLKVFWRELPITALAPQLAVLSGITIVFLLAARLMARKWETV
ncbi:MAG: ABC transporter permease [Acidobacteriota bacterium]|nr:ABC transporter permease [Acidobacteriota bacterium]